MTTTNSNTADLRKLIESRTRAKAVRGLKDDRSFSSFWMDKDDWGTALPAQRSLHGRGGASLVELIKLNAYRKAVVNFVKIISKKDIPVMWYGDQSFTNGKAICLSSNIDAKNFDVVVGLALHEASHVLLTDFEVLNSTFKPKPFAMTPLADKVEEMAIKIDKHFATSVWSATNFIHGIHNWIEDRRIDHFVFSTSPGYKAYYHKLYDHYWNTKDVIRGIRSSRYRDSSNLDSWEFHIYNFLSPAIDLNALKGLKEVYAAIDLNNPQRWTSVEDTIETTLQVMEVILANATAIPPALKDVEDPIIPPPPSFLGGEDPTPPQAADDQDEADDEDQDEPDEEDQDEAEEEQLELPQPTEQQLDNMRKQMEINNLFGQQQEEEQQEQDTEEQQEQDTAQDQPTPADTSSAAADAARRALEAQRNFLNGEGMKKEAKKNMQRQLESLSTQDLELQTTQFNGVVAVVQDYTSANVLNYINLAEAKVDATIDQRHEINKQLAEANDFGVNRNDFSAARSSRYTVAITQGIELGGLLSRKLVQHAEQRVTVTNRLRSGKVDPRRIPHVGYGIESIFSQTSIVQCKPSHIHLSLDASGSMSGHRWIETIKMTIAIAKAASKAQKISVSVDVRKNLGEQVRTVIIYDSRCNKFHHLVSVLGCISPDGGTPEGLCFDALITGKHLTPGSPTLDSYFINLSDGEPAGPMNYYGNVAVHHTRKQVERIGALGIKTLSYFIRESYNNEPLKCSSAFTQMYGSGAKAIDTKSVTQIATTLNAMLMSSHQA